MEAVGLLQEWVRDIGSHAGLSSAPENVRIFSGSVGVPESRLEVGSSLVSSLHVGTEHCSVLADIWCDEMHPNLSKCRPRQLCRGASCMPPSMSRQQACVSPGQVLALQTAYAPRMIACPSTKVVSSKSGMHSLCNAPDAEAFIYA